MCVCMLRCLCVIVCLYGFERAVAVREDREGVPCRGGLLRRFVCSHAVVARAAVRMHSPRQNQQHSLHTGASLIRQTREGTTKGGQTFEGKLLNQMGGYN